MARNRGNPALRLIGIIFVLAITIDTLQRLAAVSHYRSQTKLLSK